MQRISIIHSRSNGLCRLSKMHTYPHTVLTSTGNRYPWNIDIHETRVIHTSTYENFPRWVTYKIFPASKISEVPRKFCGTNSIGHSVLLKEYRLHRTILQHPSAFFSHWCVCVLRISENYEYEWPLMEHRYPWGIDIHGIASISMDQHQYPWMSINIHGWASISMKHRYPWRSIDIHRRASISIEHRYPLSIDINWTSISIVCRSLR